MTHIRTTIRNAFVAQLIADSVASGNVLNTRTRPVEDDTYPAVFVSVLNDNVNYDQSAFGGGFYKQMRELEVEIIIKSVNSDGSAVASEIDGVSEAIEESIYNKRKLGLGVINTVFTSFTYDYEIDSTVTRGTGTLLFTVLYQIQEPETSTLV